MISTSNNTDYLTVLKNGIILDKTLTEYKKVNEKAFKILTDNILSTSPIFEKLIEILVKKFDDNENSKQILKNAISLNNANIRNIELFEILLDHLGYFNFENVLTSAVTFDKDNKKNIEDFKCDHDSNQEEENLQKFDFNDKDIKKIIEKLENDIDDKELMKEFMGTLKYNF